MGTLNKISVIVPVYNTEQYLHRCVNSIMEQTYENLEIILVNDGSSDNSGKICDQFSEKDSRIKTFHQENKGQSAARNHGIQIATGNFIAFVDSDDWIDKNMYEDMLSIMIEHNLEVVECNVINRYEDSQLKTHQKSEVVFEDRLLALKRVIANQYFSVCRRLYSKSILSHLRFPEGVFAEDVYFTINFISSVEKIAILSNPFYNYFKLGESTTRGPFKLKILGTIDAALYAETKIKENEYDKELISIVKKFILTILLYNYKAMHHYPETDADYTHRKRVKNQIKNYLDLDTLTFQLTLSRILPITWYSSILQLNKKIKKR